LSHRSEGGERVILVHLHLRDNHYYSDKEEFQALAMSAGAFIVADFSVNRAAPDPKYFIGTGKVNELQALVAEEEAVLVIFDHALTPSQERNLERSLKCRVLDRTGLILDIFAQRARTYEGKLQVELAQLQHQSTRLIRGWTHLERQKGGIGLRGGPGETQLEVDRRQLRERIKHIKIRLEKVRKQREQGRRSRKKAMLPIVSLVGYTNAGKSTLFNRLTGSEVYVANKLFATLDPTLRTLDIPPIGKVVFADTVGFVRDLPHDLVEAFKATLEETKEADLLLHIIDANDRDWLLHSKAVESVLEEIGADDIPRIEVYNKIDLMPALPAHNERGITGQIQKIFVSAVTGTGLDRLTESISKHLALDMIVTELCLTPHAAKLRANLFEQGSVVSERMDDAGNFWMNVHMPRIRWLELSKLYPDLPDYLNIGTEMELKDEKRDEDGLE
jgi:GTP-binding protein HflX